MNDLQIIIIACAGGLAFILVIVLIAYKVATKDDKNKEKNPLLEKGNVFVYQRNQEIPKEDSIKMNARFYLRSTVYSLQERLNQFGSRQDKTYFTILGNSLNKEENERVMSMTPVSKTWPIPLNTEAGKYTFRTIIKSLELHPFISVPLVVDFIQDKSVGVSIRPFYAKGSLRDYIHQAKPKNGTYSQRYETHFSLNEKIISKFGRQILEGLLFLKENNFPYFHLNCGNILLDDSTCLISDFENAFLGLKPRYADFITKFSDKLDAEVLTFGLVLFEMGCGYEVENPEAVEIGIPSHCHPEVKKVLESIFKPWYGNPPTLEELTKIEFFSSHKFKNLPTQKITYTSKEREMIDAVLKLNKGYLVNSGTVEKIPKFKDFKKQKKRKSLANPNAYSEIPLEVSTSNVTPMSSSLPSSFVSQNQSKSNFSSFTSNNNNNNNNNMNNMNSSLPTTSSSSYTPSTAVTSAPAPSPMSSSIPKPASSAPPPPPPPPAAKGAPPPPPPPPPAKGAPPPPPPPSIAPPPSSGGRKNLLSSIENFSAGSLKKTKTVDKSGPKLKK
ncbi:hypothetical protein CYY_003726 [Polysphondylium violaceum]|uniref:WH2 domain-containing protein n=1 Tax=Polysphondylium violaceum TaxID=133409 RepID=A0A8J4V5R5_9MYCE|nr:hypothetical protein CYY_003726 [Polysphondylium violaceum]